MTRIGWALILLLAASGAAFGAGEDEGIAARCENEWPQDYAMQEYCAGRQQDGLTALHDFMARYGITPENDRSRYDSGDPPARILHDCASEWHDRFGTDWNMTAYCVRRQEEAAKRLGKLHE